MVGSSTPLDLLTPSLPSTPSPSTRSNSALKLSSSPSSLSLSSSASRTCFATLNFLVSSSTISAACFAPPSCATTVSLCCDWRVLSWRVSLRSAVSASRRRRERDSSSVLREEEIRDKAALSGAMLKFVIVWAMSWDRSQPAALAGRNARWSITVAGSSSRSMAAVRCIRSFSWNSFGCTINQRSEGMIQQGLRQMFSGMQNNLRRAFVDALQNWHSATTGNIWMWHSPTSSAPQSVLLVEAFYYLKHSTVCVPQSISILRTYYTQFTSIQRLGLSIDGVEFTLYVQRDGRNFKLMPAHMLTFADAADAERYIM